MAHVLASWTAGPVSLQCRLFQSDSLICGPKPAVFKQAGLTRYPAMVFVAIKEKLWHCNIVYLLSNHTLEKISYAKVLVIILLFTKICSLFMKLIDEVIEHIRIMLLTLTYPISKSLFFIS